MPDIYIPTGNLNAVSHGVEWSLPFTERLAVNTTALGEVGEGLGYEEVHFRAFDPELPEEDFAPVTVEEGVATVTLRTPLKQDHNHEEAIDAASSEDAKFIGQAGSLRHVGQRALAGYLDAEARGRLMEASSQQFERIREAPHPLRGVLGGFGAFVLANTVLERASDVQLSVPTILAVQSLAMFAAYLPAAYGKSLTQYPAALDRHKAVTRVLKDDRPLIMFTDGGAVTRPTGGTPTRQRWQNAVRALRPGIAPA